LNKNITDNHEKKLQNTLDTDTQDEQDVNNPKDLCCECFGRAITTLTPFHWSGMINLFEGSLLIKSYEQKVGPYNEEAEVAWRKAINYFPETCNKSINLYEWMIKEYGKSKGKIYYTSCQAFQQIDNIWMCSECDALTKNEIFEKWFMRKYYKNRK
jgi:hypothetical protein